jgi:hypothetical protein
MSFSCNSRVSLTQEWKFLEARDSVLKSHYVIANFAKILGAAIHNRSRFSGKQLT